MQNSNIMPYSTPSNAKSLRSRKETLRASRPSMNIQKMINSQLINYLTLNLVLFISIFAVFTDAQNVQPELLYVDPYTGIGYGYVVARPAQRNSQLDNSFEDEMLAENPMLNPIIKQEKFIRQALGQQPPSMRHQQPSNVNTAAKRSTGSAPAAVKRERIIMDALGGDYLIRKRTMY